MKSSFVNVACVIILAQSTVTARNVDTVMAMAADFQRFMTRFSMMVVASPADAEALRLDHLQRFVAVTVLDGKHEDFITRWPASILKHIWSG